MRRHLDFNDFVFWSLSALLLTLTVPVLPGWLQFSGTRKLIVTITFLAGAVSLWAAFYRSCFFKDAPTDRIDLWDWVMAASGLFFAVAAYRNWFRWSYAGMAGMTFHKMGIVVVLACISLFAFYCIIDRGGMRKFMAICFFLGFILLVPASWKIATGSFSPRYFYISEPKETGYAWLVSALLFIAGGVISYVIQKHRGNRG